jgi:hypothetical protein
VGGKQPLCCRLPACGGGRCSEEATGNKRDEETSRMRSKDGDGRLD